MSDELEGELCKLLRHNFCRSCYLLKPPFCKGVVGLANFVQEKIEEAEDDLLKEGVVKPSKTPGLGIPSFNRVEKLSAVVPVKVQPSLKKAIPRPQSTWIRNVIIEKLERMKEEQT